LGRGWGRGGRPPSASPHRGGDGSAPSGSPPRRGLTGTGREVLKCFQRGHTRPLLSLCELALLTACAAPMLAGCGSGEGVEDGATATVYVAAGPCSQAQRALESKGPEGDTVRLRIVCVPSTEKRGRFDLAQIGANARRATEDSTTIAYIGELEPRAVHFSETILEEAGIAQIPETSGAAAMAQLLQALNHASGDSGSLRQSIDDELS
jgi:hypothetical protein